MKDNYYSQIKRNLSKNNNSKEDYNIIVIIKYFDSVLLLKDENGNYDFLSFKTLSFDIESIKNQIIKILNCKLAIKFEGYVQKKENGSFFYIFSSTINSLKLNELKRNLDFKIVSVNNIEKEYKDDKAELIYKINGPGDGFLSLLFISFLIVVAIVAIFIFVFNLINGKIKIELLIYLIGLGIATVLGLFHFIRK